MPEYTAAAVVGLLAVVVAELVWFRSGVLRLRAFWVSMAICLLFMVVTNGWLTKLSAPIVLYNAATKSPWRVPWDIPVEDYLFGFALLTLVTVVWQWDGRRSGVEPTGRHRAPATDAEPRDAAAAPH